MKQPKRVAELLAELRELAETDFERHRLDVLERDLTAPPVVEVIDESHQRFLGFIYRAESKGHFVRSQFVHRDVWQYYHGDIPEGDYEIHHIDHNKANNDIANLQLLTRTEHGCLHTKHIRNPDKKCTVCGKIFHPRPASQKYCSQSCYHGYVTQQSYERICPCCGKTFKARHIYNIYCSKACSDKMKIKPFVEKRCANCGKTFQTKEHAQSRKYCSTTCAYEARRKK